MTRVNPAQPGWRRGWKRSTLVASAIALAFVLGTQFGRAGLVPLALWPVPATPALLGRPAVIDPALVDAYRQIADRYSIGWAVCQPAPQPTCEAWPARTLPEAATWDRRVAWALLKPIAATTRHLVLVVRDANVQDAQLMAIGAPGVVRTEPALSPDDVLFYEFRDLAPGRYLFLVTIATRQTPAFRYDAAGITIAGG